MSSKSGQAVLPVVHEFAAGIDIGSRFHVVAVAPEIVFLSANATRQSHSTGYGLAIPIVLLSIINRHYYIGCFKRLSKQHFRNPLPSSR